LRCGVDHQRVSAHSAPAYAAPGLYCLAAKPWLPGTPEVELRILSLSSQCLLARDARPTPRRVCSNGRIGSHHAGDNASRDEGNAVPARLNGALTDGADRRAGHGPGRVVLYALQHVGNKTGIFPNTGSSSDAAPLRLATPRRDTSPEQTG